MTTEDEVVERVHALLDWGAVQLDLLSSAFRGCDDEELECLRRAQGVSSLPAAYAAFMRAAGVGGPGSAIAELFPGDDVAAESMLAEDDWPGARRIAEEILEETGSSLVLGRDLLVIRVFRAEEFEYVDVGAADAPVFRVGVRNASPIEAFDSFTAWLEYRIARAIKRRYPLRDAHFPVRPRTE